MKLFKRILFLYSLQFFLVLPSFSSTSLIAESTRGGIAPVPCPFLDIPFSSSLRITSETGTVNEDLLLEASLLSYHQRVTNYAFSVHEPRLPVKVTRILFGPSDAKPKKFTVSKTNFDSTLSTVEQYIEKNLPIEGVTYWGGARHYGRGDRRGADITDLLALLRYEAMNQAVQFAGYIPGIKAHIIFEDLGRRFMGQDTPDMFDRVKIYGSELRNLVSVVAPHVVFETESEMLERTDVPPIVRKILNLDPTAPQKGSADLFFRLAKLAEGIIFTYLRKTEDAAFLAPLDADDTKGFERIKSLKEFQALEELGFSGGIPMAQRESVRRRTLVRLGLSHMEPTDLDTHVAKYFAQAFARAKFGARNSRNLTTEGDSLPRLSYSFLPYPPGTPEKMITRRIELSAIYGSEDEVVPCWGGYGVISGFNYKTLRIKIEKPESVPVGLFSVRFTVTNDKGRHASFDATFSSRN